MIMRGRPRQFDVDEVLNRAMEVFWEKGYEATSMVDLLAATGLHKGSLYQAFGNKHALFIAALQRYLENMQAHENAILDNAPTPLDGIRAVGHSLLDLADESRGCLGVNTMVELAPHDPKVASILNQHMLKARHGLMATVTQAQRQGQMSPSRSPELIAMLLMTFTSGLAANMKGLMPLVQAHQLFDAQLDVLS